MLMNSISETIDDLENMGYEYAKKEKYLKAFALSALSKFLDGALYGCVCIGIGVIGITIGTMIHNKKNNN